ncbi:MAG: cell division control protein Cdc6, partial [Methanofollis sp.]|nr:cell division control protein Cdc6 [Methanofollis sp.]
APQLCDILAQRAEMAFVEGSLEEGVIPLCAAFAAQEHGDARRALDLLRVSGELADRENAAEVKEKHVRMALEKIETDSMIECISTLPTQSKVVLYSMLLLEQMDKKIFTSGEVTRVYREVSRIVNIDPLTHRRITDLISELNMLGVINTRVVSKGRYGRTKEMWFDSNTKKIQEVLAKDPRLSEERLAQVDLNRLKASFR